MPGWRRGGVCARKSFGRGRRTIPSKNLMEIGEHEMRNGTRTLYWIVVRDELSERLTTAFEGMEARSGVTVLTGDVIDHSHSNSTHPPQLEP
jgi:hypothetical protein